MMEISGKKNHKILIVDDQQKNIQVLGSLLRQKNYIIGVATNGKQALEILKESNDYDLVLLDVNMPVMNGFEACKAIREHEKLKEIPIIFLTAMVDTYSTVTGFEAGGQDYVTKPFNANELLARVNTHLELKYSKDQLRQVNKWLEQKVDERTEELQIANKQLLQLGRAKSEFLSIISHEIRTPLNGIIGPLSILKDYQIPQDVSEMLNILDKSANRLMKFSNKALDISLFNTKGKEVLDLRLSDLNEIINAQVIRFQKNAQLKDMAITYTNETNDSLVMLDEGFMTKTFSYIIDNAIKFGTKHSRIIIRKTSLQKNFVLTFEDEGKPFPEDYSIANIQPFNTKNHVDENPALSLFLCKQIIEAHNGQIEILNTKNGVIVSVIIPKIGIN